MNPYEILGVSKDDTIITIRVAYKRLAQKLHPDRVGGDKAKFQDLQEAFHVLSDPERRARYDSTGQTKAGPSVEEIARDAFVKLVLECMQHANEYTNLFDMVIDKIVEAQGARKDQQNQFTKELERMQKVVGRINYKGTGPNLALNMANRKIEELNRTIDSIATGAKVLDMMLEMVKDYDYTTDKRNDSAFENFGHSYGGFFGMGNGNY